MYTAAEQLGLSSRENRLRGDSLETPSLNSRLATFTAIHRAGLGISWWRWRGSFRVPPGKCSPGQGRWKLCQRLFLILNPNRLVKASARRAAGVVSSRDALLGLRITTRARFVRFVRLVFIASLFFLVLVTDYFLRWSSYWESRSIRSQDPPFYFWEPAQGVGRSALAHCRLVCLRDLTACLARCLVEICAQDSRFLRGQLIVYYRCNVHWLSFSDC